MGRPRRREQRAAHLAHRARSLLIRRMLMLCGFVLAGWVIGASPAYADSALSQTSEAVSGAVGEADAPAGAAGAARSDTGADGSGTAEGVAETAEATAENVAEAADGTDAAPVDAVRPTPNVSDLPDLGSQARGVVEDVTPVGSEAPDRGEAGASGGAEGAADEGTEPEHGTESAEGAEPVRGEAQPRAAEQGTRTVAPEAALADFDIERADHSPESGGEHHADGAERTAAYGYAPVQNNTGSMAGVAGYLTSEPQAHRGAASLVTPSATAQRSARAVVREPSFSPD